MFNYNEEMQKLQEKLFTEEVIVFAEKSGFKLLANIDLFNGHIIWEVEETYDGNTYWTDFTDRLEAFKYYLDCQEGSANGT